MNLNIINNIDDLSITAEPKEIAEYIFSKPLGIY
jgi:hypothetical protein